MSRPRGIPNKDTKSLMDKAKELNCDPFEILIHFAKGDWKALKFKNAETVKFYTKEGPIMEDTISPDLRLQATKELCQYLLPKRKAIEHTVDPALEGAVRQVSSMTKDQKIQAHEIALKELKGNA